MLAVLANLCYSSVYLVDLALPPAAPDAPRRWRGWLFAAGTLFALFVTQYWIGDEIYPSVR